nr:immunoglobulin heavy chain junction region [Macaca mulatta]MOW87278.1 immunoglobulin heavy chain junction region [Macaca mulatta]MOW87362.1 immunoglobulin heavy chain junction region [Macaca mulatta]MOW87505.1 immunoglobulin heavy chain junction region [Macaca mulatta]MOW87727.1 immunoglobulin heavy chain junction region [Macaca mulatta]
CGRFEVEVVSPTPIYW